MPISPRPVAPGQILPTYRPQPVGYTQPTAQKKPCVGCAKKGKVGGCSSCG